MIVGGETPRSERDRGKITVIGFKKQKSSEKQLIGLGSNWTRKRIRVPDGVTRRGGEGLLGLGISRISEWELGGLEKVGRLFA